MPHFFARRQGDRVEIDGADASHLALSLRARPGELIQVLDPPERRLTVRLQLVSRDLVTGLIEEEEVHRPEPQSRITLALAQLPAAQMDLALARCTELGAHAFLVVRAERSVARGANLRRWSAVCREAAMLAGRFHIPEIQGPINLMELDQAVLLHAGAPTPLRSISAPRDVTLAIGPEGGWSQAELSWAGSRQA